MLSGGPFCAWIPHVGRCASMKSITLALDQSLQATEAACPCMEPCQRCSKTLCHHTPGADLPVQRCKQECARQTHLSSIDSHTVSQGSNMCVDCCCCFAASLPSTRFHIGRPLETPQLPCSALLPKCINMQESRPFSYCPPVLSRHKTILDGSAAGRSRIAL